MVVYVKHNNLENYMDNNQLVFFKLLTCGIGNEVESLADIRVLSDKVVELTNIHQCIPFVYSACKKYRIKTPLVWRHQTIYSAVNNTQKLVVQNKVCDVLNGLGIPFAVFKGSSVAVNYPQPDIRSLGDIDILVSENSYEQAIKAFIGEIRKEDAWHEFHFTLSMDSVEIEIHKYITHEPHTKEEKNVYNIMKSCLDDIDYCRYDNYKFPVLRNKYHAIALLLHKKRHLDSNNITIRMVCDWAFFVQSVDLDEWNDDVYPFIKEAGFGLFSDAFTLLADKYLGFKNKEKVKLSISDDIISDLADILLRCGPRREVSDMSAPIGSIYSKYADAGRFRGLIRTVNTIIRDRYPLARYKILIPFFYIYTSIKYMIGVFMKKREKVDFSDVTLLGSKRRKIYKVLKLDRLT